MELFIAGISVGLIIGFMTVLLSPLENGRYGKIPDNPEQSLPPVNSLPPPMPKCNDPKPQGPPNRDVRTNKPVPSCRYNRRYF